jgi:hypothetical protein
MLGSRERSDQPAASRHYGENRSSVQIFGMSRNATIRFLGARTEFAEACVSALLKEPRAYTCTVHVRALEHFMETSAQPRKPMLSAQINSLLS